MAWLQIVGELNCSSLRSVERWYWVVLFSAESLDHFSAFDAESLDLHSIPRVSI